MSHNIEGFWILHIGDVDQPKFIDGQSSSGVLILEAGRVFGGDSRFYWSGQYQVNGRHVTGSAKSTHYSGRQMTVFGLDIRQADFSLAAIRTDEATIHGNVSATSFDGHPAPAGSPYRPVWLKKVEDLPLNWVH
ncbi:MAG: negative regulator,GrlR [Rubritepida sp.]|nr:negative regulator,GrlR [Rubritepida sp.]